MTRPGGAVHPGRLLDDGRRLAAVAGVVLLVSLFLPWYEKSVVPAGSKTFATQNLSAFGAFTWIEAALLLVDAAILALMWLRSQGRRIELPADDGTMIAFGAGWALVLLIVRVFDKPHVEGVGASVGLQWGMLIAFGAAGAMLAAGLLIRAVEHHAQAASGDVSGETSAATAADRQPSERGKSLG